MLCELSWEQYNRTLCKWALEWLIEYLLIDHMMEYYNATNNEYGFSHQGVHETIGSQ
jgi:hypothetical protein